MSKKGCLGVLLWLLAGQATAMESVQVQLRWQHQFQFAGYYVAKEFGYYADAGLDVTLLENGPGQPSSITAVALGQAQFGVANTGVLTAFARGEPVMAVASIFQHSPMAWVVRTDSGIHNLHDLVGKTLMSQQPREQVAELLSPFVLEAIPLESMTWVPSRFNIDALVNGEVDAFAGYLSNEPYVLSRRGVPFVTISPRTYGVDFYGDLLITNSQLARDNPELIKRFRDASLKGWRTALENIDGTARLIKAQYAPQKSLDQLRFEGEVIREMVMPDLVTIGHMNLGRWSRILELHQQLGLIPPQASLDGFLFQPKVQAPSSPVWSWLAAALGLALLIAILVIYQFMRLNNRLSREIGKRQEIEKELRSQAYTDPLTGTGNRRALMEVGHQRFASAVREDRPLSLVMVDVDHFKRINDSYGHDVGDLVLRHLGDLLHQAVRSSDFVGRLGGEEFALLLPDSGLEAAMATARRLKSRMVQKPFELNPHESIAISISAGVVSRQGADSCFEQMLSRADQLLYDAKAAGRDQICRESCVSCPLPKLPNDPKVRPFPDLGDRQKS